MSTSTIESDRWSKVGAALRGLSAMPLVQSGVSLLASPIVTSTLGLLFWLVAARHYSAARLGIGSAVIAVVLLLGGLAQLGLKAGLVKYLPVAGTGTTQLVVRSYGVAVAVAVVGSAVFVAGIPIWASALGALRSSMFLAALFVVSSAFWVVVTLEGSVLAGLRLAPWGPVENGAIGLLKILLLLPLASMGGDFGVFLAWAIPVFPVVAVVNGLVARRGLPATDDTSTEPAFTMGEVLGYSVVDRSTRAPRIAVVGVLPLVVLAQLGPSQTAYYFLASTTAFIVYLVGARASHALAGEASSGDENVERRTLHRGLLGSAVSVPIVVVAVLLAPMVLGAFGADFADEATPVLRLLLVGAIPNVVARGHVARLRAERRLRAAFLYELFLASGVLLLGWFLISPLGIAGLGVAWLVALTVAALYAVIAQSVWWWAPPLDPGRVVAFDRRLQPLRRLALRLPSFRLDRDVRRSLRDRYTSRPRWRRVGLSADLQTVSVAGADGRPPLTVGLARSEWGDEILARRSKVVAELADIDAIASLRPLLPVPIDNDRSGGRHFMMESAISGRTGAELAIEDSDLVVDAVAEALAALYDATGSWMTFDRERLHRWVSLPLRHLGDAARVPAEDLVAVGRALCTALEGVVAPSARLHGNMVLENFLFDRSGKLTGVVNWEYSDVGPVFLDRSAIALSSLLVDAGEDAGHVVVELLGDPDRLLEHRALGCTSLPKSDPKMLVLLAWLHRLGPTLQSAVTRPPSQFWVARNVTPVLAALERR